MEQAQQEFLSFLEEYNSFLSEAVRAQNEKIEALLTHNVEVIEQSIARQQTVAMQMTRHEELRQKLQGQAGLDGLTFREVLDRMQGPSREAFERQYLKMQDQINQIKFLNDRAMRLVETNLEVINMTALIEERKEMQSYDGKGKQQNAVPKNSIFETKI